MNMFFHKWNLKKFIAFISIATALALMSIGVIVTTEYANDFEFISKKGFAFFFPRVIDEFTGVYSFFFLIPFLIYFFDKFPLTKNNYKQRLSAYLLATATIGIIHTGMMYSSRTILYPIFNLGEYDYGFIPYRILMEYFKQFLSFWAVYIVFAIFKVNREKEEEKLRAVQLEEQLTKTKLQALSSQLNPHFLFNTLNMISSVMYNDPKTADKMISNLSELLRATLGGTMRKFHSLKNEIEILNLYLEIMKARFADKLNIVINIDENVSDRKVPWFILQPLVENSIKYCMNETNPAEIKISASLKNSSLILSVTDNGPGFSDKAKALENSGVGLTNLVERLENLYLKNYSFEINNLDEGGAEVKIEIPFIEVQSKNRNE